MKDTNKILLSMKEWIDVFMRNSGHSMFHFAKENGLSMSQIGALFQIQRKGFSGVSDIGSDLGITNPAASQMLERLVNLDLVIRSEDPLDRRGKKIELTEKGSHILKESIQAHQGWCHALVSLLTPQEQAQVQVVLDLLVEKAHLLEQQSRPES